MAILPPSVAVESCPFLADAALHESDDGVGLVHGPAAGGAGEGFGPVRGGGGEGLALEQEFGWQLGLFKGAAWWGGYCWRGALRGEHSVGWVEAVSGF